jgi:hypothetical protein
MADVAATTRASGRVANDIAHSDGLSALARWGLAARATNYLLVGVLVAALAFGSHHGETDQHGALQETANHTGGAVLVWVIAIGLAAYAVWRLSETAFGVAGKRDEIGPRLLSLWRAVVYAVIAVNAFRVAVGSGNQNQAGKEQSYSATVMRHAGGRWLIAGLGVALAVFGIVLIVKGVKRKFEKSLELARIPTRMRGLVDVLGTAGNAGRGLVFVMVGAFVVAAAVDYDPQKAAGLDGALRNLRDATGGPVLLIAVAVGLLLFGAYGYCEAAWKRTN